MESWVEGRFVVVCRWTLTSHSVNIRERSGEGKIENERERGSL